MPAIYSLLGVIGGGLAPKELSGSWNMVIGGSVDNVYGSRNENYFGDSSSMVVAGKWLGIGALLGNFQMSNSAGLLGLTGVGGNLDTTYGKRVELTYGGPTNVFQRGEVFKKTHRPLPMVGGSLGAGISSVISAIELWYEQALAEARNEKWNAPEPPPPDQGLVNRAAYLVAIDEKYERLISRFSKLMTVTSIAMDFAVRFKYPNYRPSDGGIFTSPASAILFARKILTDLCMGVIHQCELACVHDNELMFAISKLTNKLDQIVKKTTSFATAAKSAIKRALVRTLEILKRVIYYTFWIILNLLAIAAILALLTLSIAGTAAFT